jgi:hypothetical protein
VAWIIATCGALVLGIVTNLAYDLIKTGSIRLPGRIDRRALPQSARRHDIADDGMTPLVTWSRERPLSPQSLETTFVGRLERAHFLDNSEWNANVSKYVELGRAGRTAYIANIEVDTHEHERAQRFRVSIAESSYAECLAALETTTDRKHVARVSAELSRGLSQFTSNAPPTMVSACISVVSRNGMVLALRRSLAVEVFPGQWTLGINESMKYRSEPGDAEDFYSLIRRGLKEELGLDSQDYGKIVLSWLGWSSSAMCWIIVAAVKSRLHPSEIEGRRNDCHSVYEHDSILWIPLARKPLANIVLNRCHQLGGTGTWSYLAPTVAMETWRIRNQL